MSSAFMCSFNLWSHNNDINLYCSSVGLLGLSKIIINNYYYNLWVRYCSTLIWVDFSNFTWVIFMSANVLSLEKVSFRGVIVLPELSVRVRFAELNPPLMTNTETHIDKVSDYLVYIVKYLQHSNTHSNTHYTTAWSLLFQSVNIELHTLSRNNVTSEFILSHVSVHLMNVNSQLFANMLIIKRWLLVSVAFTAYSAVPKWPENQLMHFPGMNANCIWQSTTKDN